jgi:CRP-like cAMP-binding protein
MVLPTSFLFQGLTGPQLHRLTKFITEVGMAPGQWLLHEGQKGDELYVIQKGAVELIIELNDAFLPISVLRAAGQCFGTSALIAPHQYSISAHCLEGGCC